MSERKLPNKSAWNIALLVIAAIGELTVATLVAVSTALLSAQQKSESAQQPARTSDQTAMSNWQLMQDGVAFFTFNRQGGPRGGTEFKSQNWWMGMAGRQVGRGMLNLSTMLSLDPATVGKRGYRELFQSGEAANGLPIVDRQHPLDFVGQLAASWRVPLDQPCAKERRPACRSQNERGAFRRRSFACG